tara:strand:- start:5490 stop:6185 length:696 start_codon:yes stop_codon:yes gene_type:complete
MANGAENFMSALGGIQNKLNDQLPTLASRLARLSDQELTIIARELDFFQELNRLGYSDALTDLMNEYDDVATKVFNQARSRGLQVQVATAQNLELIKELDAGTLLGRARDFSSRYKSELLRGIIAGESGRQIVDRLTATLGTELTSANLNLIVNDSFAKFSNSATFQAFADEPQTRYRYVGVLDGKTRDSCRQVLEDGQNSEGYTMEEIFDLPVGFDDRGGFNCRHDWVVI